MPYTIRLMCKDDITQVTGIDREAFDSQWPPPNYKRELENQLASYIVVLDDTRMVTEPADKPGQGFNGLISRTKRWVTHNHAPDEEPAVIQKPYVMGFAGMWVMAGEAHITNIAVRQQYQRQGIGELMIISLTDLAIKLYADAMTLEVRVSNSVARSLYTKCGFAEAGIRRGYYLDNREDGIIMSTADFSSAPFQEQLQQLKQAHSSRWGEAGNQLSGN